MNDPEPPAIGIDLGTTNTVVAHVAADGKLKVLPNQAGDLLTPSVVYYGESSRIVGREAKELKATFPTRVADFAKRHISRDYYPRLINGEQLRPEEILSDILCELTKTVEFRLGAARSAVITVPAYYTDEFRRKTWDAGVAADLNVIDIINEPTAAGLFYGYEAGFLDGSGRARTPERILVYDLGGGTFDCTILEMEADRCAVLATLGDVELGGVDWDKVLEEFLRDSFKREFRGLDLAGSDDSLLEMAEAAKIKLSSQHETRVFLESHGRSLEVPISRKEFETASAYRLQRTMTTVEEVIEEAENVKPGAITRVLLVGGATRMPAVTTSLRRIAGLESVPLDTTGSPDTSVALGAALHANSLSIGSRQATWGRTTSAFSPPRTPTYGSVQFQDVNSHSVGVVAVNRKTRQRQYSELIPKNTPLPASSRPREYATIVDNQRQVKVEVVEGIQGGPWHDTPIREFFVTLPAGLPKGSLLTIEMQIRSNGLIKTVVRIGGTIVEDFGEYSPDPILPAPDLPDRSGSEQLRNR